MRLKALFIGLLGCLASCQVRPAYATEQTQIIGPFGGLNTQDSPAIISASQAQDLLNVDISPGGKSVKKREGLALDATFSVSTGPIHGSYKFFDSNGNEVRLWGQDTGLWSSVGGLSYVRVSTGTVGATWQCTDYLGYAYCLTSARDSPVKTNGTVAGTTFETTIPAGTMVASTPERLLVSGVSGQAQRIYYSAGSNFTNFTLGTQASSSSFEDITTPGSAVTHIAYHHGRWEFWKDQSFGFILGTDQTNLDLKTVSDTIGTFDNSDVYDNGLCYFRGNDNQFYTYDGNTLARISRDITPTVNSANRRKSNTWSQTSQTDLATGSILPVRQLSTSISPGDVIVSSFQANEYTTTGQWSNGSALNTTVGTSSITLTINNTGAVTNNSFENGTVDIADVTGWTEGSDNGVLERTQVTSPCTLNPQSGSRFVEVRINSAGWLATAKLTDIAGNTLYTLTIPTTDNGCSWVQDTISSAGLVGRRVKLKLSVADSIFSNTSITTSDSFILGGDITFYRSLNKVASPGTWSQAFDNIQNGSSTITSGSFTSQTYDTGFTSATYAITSLTYTVGTSTPTFAIVTSSTSSGGTWSTVVSTTGVGGPGQRYARWVSTLSVTSVDDAQTYISSVTILARSTGTYYSAVNNAANLTSWASISMTDFTNGGSTITYYTRSSTSTFTVLSSTPPWVLQPKNGNVATSTGTYFQLRGDFSVTAATETPYLSDFTFNWYEGNAADKMYGTYFNYAVLFAVSLGTTTSANNRILRYDLLNQGWTMYDIASNGFLTYATNLYTGDATAGKTYKFGGVTSDNNAAINSYWKSKDFFGSSPFSDDDLRTMSWYCKASSGTTLSVNYNVNESSTTSYTINLYDSLSNVIRHNRTVPAGTTSNVLNVQIGDNSSNPGWECFAGQFTYEPRPWSVYP